MKDNISIIFAALIGVFLVVLLPLFSLLDRQDSMAYNVVLTATTNFVDKIRTDGFIDRDSYNNYIAAMASTGNTYKVRIKAYKKLLINDTDNDGNIIADSYIEEKELYNTQDILKQLELGAGEKTEESIYKNNTYLFNKNDEIYVSVENTNITTGSIIYSLLANVSNIKIVDINYGGVINNINWELYEKITNEASTVPEILMSVPVNKNNSTNVTKVDNTGVTEYIECTLDNLEAGIDEETLREVCEDLAFQEGQNYTYLYDLSKPENKQIRVAIELRGVDKIDTGTNIEGQDPYKSLSELYTAEDVFDDEDGKSDIEKYIIENYIITYGMYSPDIDIDLRKNKDYYVFDIYFNNVVMGSIDYISTKANIVILPGLGQDENGVLSLGSESVEMELLDEEAVNTVKISSPHIWKKFLKTKSRTESVISTNTVYAKEDIAFVVSYTGIRDHSQEEIKQALMQHLSIHANDRQIDGLEVYTEQELKDKYDIDISTATAGHLFIKFRYTEPNTSDEPNYVQIQDNWIATNMVGIAEEELGYEVREYAMGAVSSHYKVLEDNSPPLQPTIELEGTKKNGWYSSNVKLTVIPSSNDTIKKGNNVEVGGSGVERNTLALTGATTLSESEIDSYEIITNGTTYATVKAYDYVGNGSEPKVETIQIDKENPTVPEIKIVSGDEGTNDWYKTDVRIEIVPGTDNISGVEKTTYKIEGANALAETEGKIYTLKENGTSTITATTYDKAGNKSETALTIKIDKTEAPDAVISVVSGEGRLNSQLNVYWYYTEVKLKVDISATEAVSGFGGATYKIIGPNELAVTPLENDAEIILDKNGTHTVFVYTYTGAGRVKTTQYTVQIDKDAPNKPTIKIINGTPGENNWYTSNVEVEVIPNGDIGPSLESQITYTITKDGVTSSEKDITNISKTIDEFEQDGIYLLKVYSRDTALNEVSVEETIKVDRTAPTSADFVINGTKGNDGWYITDVSLSYGGGEDSVSGIKEVTLSTTSINQNTNGKQVILTTKNNAGLTTTKTTVIKVDKTAPGEPTLTLETTPYKQEGPFGIKYFNQKVKIKLAPGKDYLIDGIDNTVMTTCQIFGPTGIRSQSITGETEIEISQQGQTTITITTLDKAGNTTSMTENIYISIPKPKSPVITSINEVNVKGIATKEIESNVPEIRLNIQDITEGNKLTITLVNLDNNTKQEIKQIVNLQNMPIVINLKEQGNYSISVTQTNIFGTESDSNSGTYYYKYYKK